MSDAEHCEVNLLFRVFGVFRGGSSEWCASRLSRMTDCRWSLFGFAVGALASLHAADKSTAPTAPTLDHLFPVAAAPGSTTAVTAVGKFAHWPPQVWTDTPGISFHAGEKAGQFKVEVSPDVPAGPHLVRFFNETGASAPRFLIVATGREQIEAEPNDEFAKARLVERTPVTINGRLNKNGDVDCYALRLEAGQTLVATLDAYVLGSPVDAVLRLLDERGLEQAFNHDNGRNPDPMLTWTAPTAGNYIVQVFGFAQPATSDVRFTGSDSCVYRLNLARGAPGETGDRIQETGNGVPETAARKPEIGKSPGKNVLVSDILSPVSGFRSPVSKESTEDEYRQRRGDDSAPSSPFAVAGCIEAVGEQDRFEFTATKGEKLVLALQSASLGFPLDAWLAIKDSAGKELVRNDDGTNADPILEWTAPDSGAYVAVVGSVLHRAGPDHRYRLSVESAQPGFQGVIAESSFTVEPGKSIKIKITARRLQGFKSAMIATVTGLPEGLTANPVELNETEKEITLDVTASAEASAFSGPIQVVFREPNTDTVRHAVHELISSTSRNGVPQGFRDLVIKSTNQVWLTVRAPAPPQPTAEKQAVSEKR